VHVIACHVGVQIDMRMIAFPGAKPSTLNPGGGKGCNSIMLLTCTAHIADIKRSKILCRHDFLTSVYCSYYRLMNKTPASNAVMLCSYVCQHAWLNNLMCCHCCVVCFIHKLQPDAARPMQLQLQPTHLVSANTIVPVGSETSGGVKKVFAGGRAGAAAAAGGGLVIAVGSGMYPACRHKFTQLSDNDLT
jgi:hypothetical protein